MSALRDEIVLDLVALLLRRRATSLERMRLHRRAWGAGLEYGALTRDADLALGLVGDVPVERVLDLASHRATAAEIVAAMGRRA